MPETWELPLETDEPTGQDVNSELSAGLSPRNWTTVVGAAFCAEALLVLCISVDFALSRGELGQPVLLQAIYWACAASLPLPAMWVVLHRSLSRVSGCALLTLSAVGQYVVVQVYSPLVFRFSDEFAHLGTADAILRTGSLHVANTALPVSPQYPGLEVVTSGFQSVTGLSTYAVASVLLGVLHVLTVLGVFEIAQYVVSTTNAAAMAGLVYSCAPPFLFFEAYYTYTAIALPLALWSVVLYLRIWRQPDKRTALALGIMLLGLGTVASHHVTSYVLCATIAIVLIAVLRTRRRQLLENPTPHLVTVAVGLLALTVVWSFVLAPRTAPYFAPTIRGLVGNRPSYTPPVPTAGLPVVSASASPTPPLPVTILEALGVLSIIGSLLAVGWMLWRRVVTRGGSFVLTYFLSLAYFVLLMVRLAAGDGSELAGRLYIYVFVPLGIVLSQLLVPDSFGYHDRTRRRAVRIRATRAQLALALLATISAAGIAGGVPNYYAKLPGKYEASAMERSTDTYTLDALTWARTNIPPGVAIAADETDGDIFGAVLGDNVSPNSESILLAETFNPFIDSLIRSGHIVYAVVDFRISQHLPEDGKYFADDPLAGHYASPIPQIDLKKFDSSVESRSLFSNGVVAIYSLTPRT